eukprot:scaffold175589_cov33-Cyclotella_meneghiniana.AAC.1
MKLPTYPPTPAPTVEATSRSTACNSRPWHPTTDFQSCSNSPDYPESWNTNGNYLFDTQKHCCETYFFVEGNDCVVENSCSDEVTTIVHETLIEVPSNGDSLDDDEPPNEETTSTTSTTTDDGCELNLWHP